MKKQHPLYATIARLIGEGKSDRGISTQLGIDRLHVIKVRRKLGAPAYSRTKSVEEQLARFCSIPDPDGHVYWTGPLLTSGAPRLRAAGREAPASHSVFEQRAGRPAVGQVRADCGVKHCLAGPHLMDDIERRRVRLQTRNLLGYPPPWDVCETCGATWEEEGRIEERLTAYCRRCINRRKAENLKGKKS